MGLSTAADAQQLWKMHQKRLRGYAAIGYSVTADGDHDEIA
jgi:hypothetical protein